MDGWLENNLWGVWVVTYSGVVVYMIYIDHTWVSFPIRKLELFCWSWLPIIYKEKKKKKRENHASQHPKIENAKNQDKNIDWYKKIIPKFLNSINYV